MVPRAFTLEAMPLAAFDTLRASSRRRRLDGIAVIYRTNPMAC